MIDSLEKLAKFEKSYRDDSESFDPDGLYQWQEVVETLTVLLTENAKLKAVAKAARGVGCLCFVISQAQNCSLPPGFPQIHLQHCPADELKESLVALHEGEK